MYSQINSTLCTVIMMAALGLLGSFDPALIIRALSNTAGRVAVFLERDLSVDNLVDKPGHVTGVRLGSDLDWGWLPKFPAEQCKSTHTSL